MANADSAPKLLIVDLEKIDYNIFFYINVV